MLQGLLPALVLPSMASRQLLLRCSTSCILAVVDPGIPCRDDGVTQTLVYNDERGAWEREQNIFSDVVGCNEKSIAAIVRNKPKALLWQCLALGSQ
jgi:hypothetical protein